MAAIDFPNSPSLNQEFNTGTIIYVWDGTVWKVKSSSQPPSSSIVSYSANAPVSPVAGQVWVESDVDVNIVDITTGINLLPSQSGQNGKILKTNGESASWSLAQVQIGFSTYSMVQSSIATYNSLSTIGSYALIRDTYLRSVVLS